MKPLPEIFDAGRCDADVRRASIKVHAKRSGNMGVLSIVRRMLLAIAIMGLLLAPTAGQAHRAMNDNGAVIAMTDQAPCCPHHQPDDCAKCALASLCGSHCLNLLAVTLAAPAVTTSGIVLVNEPQSQFAVAGIKHAPPRRPPRA